MVAVIRKIVKIDEEKCNGCGACITKCAEGALKIIDGKARLVSDKYCDGLGACLGECPQGAITIEERPAAEFDEVAVEHHLEAQVQPMPCACPSAVVRDLPRAAVESKVPTEQESRLGNWPVQLALVPPHAPFLQGAEVLLAAQCTAYAYAGFHGELLDGKALLIACPKLDDVGAHLAKLTAILKQADIKSLTVVRMEVPCCAGLVYLAKQAIKASGKHIPFLEIVIGIRGDIKE